MSRSYDGGEITFDDSGMQEFEELMKQYAENVSEEKSLDAVEAGAKEFLNDLRKLPKPRSQINSPGYTHLINTFAMESITARW